MIKLLCKVVDYLLVFLFTDLVVLERFNEIPFKIRSFFFLNPDVLHDALIDGLIVGKIKMVGEFVFVFLF